jgi:antitoxin VapB
MAFNIKNEATVERARVIAERTGLSMAAVIDEAVAEHARRVEATDEERIARILKRANRIAARLSPEVLAIDHGELLYDDRGLPK